jgi:hypothetical protein
MDKGLWTREFINGVAIVRLTAGCTTRAGTGYAGWVMFDSDAQKLANSIYFEIDI